MDQQKVECKMWMVLPINIYNYIRQMAAQFSQITVSEWRDCFNDIPEMTALYGNWFQTFSKLVGLKPDIMEFAIV